jgi:phage-related protein
VSEYLGSLSEKARAGVFAVVQLLRERGNCLGLPHSRAMGNGLFELRSGQARVLYCFAGQRRAVLLHGFTKKTPQTPGQEVKTARNRMKEIQEQ